MLATLALTTLATFVQDCAELTPGFGSLGVVDFTLGGRILSSAVYDDGQGSALFVGGIFDVAGGVYARNVARFDGTAFQALPGPGGADVLLADGNGGARALATYDDGNGPALYVAGAFDPSLGYPAEGLMKWNGTTWTPVLSVSATSFSGASIAALCVWNDGTGDALYLGGAFEKVNGSPASSIAKYDGSGWTPLGAGFAGQAVLSLAVHDDGSGEKLYVGGVTPQANESLQSWDGVNWAIEPGSFDGPVRALCSHDDGSGTRLYAGGDFSTPQLRIASWDGSSWSSVGAGVLFTPTALATHDDGTGPMLYAIGSTPPMPPPGFEVRAARWDGVMWRNLGDGLNDSGATLCEFDDGSGPKLYAGGHFTHANGERVDHLGKWTANGWSTATSNWGFGAPSHSVGTVDLGSGPALYADSGTSYFDANHLNPRANVLRWTGNGWTALPGDFDNDILSIVGFDAGSGSQLIAGGFFQTVDGNPMKGLSRFDGAQWLPLGAGLNPTGGNATVRAALVHDFGAGPRLVVGGSFATAGGVTVNNIAVWDGTNWSALDLGVIGVVTSLASFDSGAGAQLYAGGTFTFAHGVPVNRLARWNGTAWQSVAGSMNSDVWALEVLDLGAGPRLYAAGGFTLAGFQPAPCVAVFDGSTWEGLVDGAGHGLTGSAFALAARDDGERVQLYAGGNILSIGGLPERYIARWDGTAWHPLDDQPNQIVRDLATFDDDSGFGPALFAVGEFELWGLEPSVGIARIAPQAPCAPVVYCTSKVNSLGCVPTMSTTGSTSLAANNLRLHASNVLNNKFGLLFWSTKPNGAPFQGGHLCCKPPIVRTTVQVTAGNPPPSDCSGSLHFQWNQAYVNQLGLPLGDWYYTQYWSRDPNSPSTTSLSDAIRFLLTP